MSSVDKSAPEGWELYIVSKEQEKNTNNEWKVGEQYYGCAAPGSLVSSQNYPSNFQQIQCQHDYIKSILSRQNVNDPRVLNTTNTTNTTNTSSNPTSNINNSTNNSAQANAKQSAANQMKMVNEFNRKQKEPNTKFNVVNPMISVLSKNDFNKENANRRKQNFKALQEKSKYTRKNPIIPARSNQSRKGFVGRQRKSKPRNTQKKRK